MLHMAPWGLPMKRVTILVLGLVMLLGAVLSSGAEATPAAGDDTWPLTYITRPCVSIGIQDASGGPPRIVCSGITGRPATITVPTPYLSDRAPELSLVTIPTLFNLGWDPASLLAQDSEPLTIPNPIGNPTDKLQNVRVQLRLRALGASAEPSESAIVSGNLSVETEDTLYLLKTDDRSDLYHYACQVPASPDLAGLANALLSIPSTYGGYGDSGCTAIEGHLDSVVTGTPAGVSWGIDEREFQRFPGWAQVAFPHFIAFSPYASIYGNGTDHGSPAFQISGTTRFVVESRVLWDLHLHKVTDTVTDCQWSYWDDYDFIDWDRWPRPIYCRRNVTVSWPIYCDPWATEGSLRCPYGHPDDWWISYGPIEVQAIRRPDGSYGTTYDFVSVQSQALLTAP